jgi:hypothetical protein
MLCDCSGITTKDAYQILGAKFLVVAHAPLWKPACMVERGVQDAFQGEKFGFRLWKVAGAGGSGSKKHESDPVYVFLTYIAVEAAMLRPGGEIRGIKCQGTWLRVMRKGVF